MTQLKNYFLFEILVKKIRFDYYYRYDNREKNFSYNILTT